MLKRFALIIMPIITIILQALPNGVALAFMGPPGAEPFIEKFSYFDAFPIGYACFSPFLTAITTCVVLLLLIIFCITNKSSLLNSVVVLLFINIFFSLCHYALQIKSITVISVLITLALVVELVAVLIYKKELSTRE